MEIVGLEGLRLMQFNVVLYNDAECINTKFGASEEDLKPCNQLAKSELIVGSQYNVLISWFFTPDNFYVILEKK